jgi:uncharacterized protein (TIGR02001 family)
MLLRFSQRRNGDIRLLRPQDNEKDKLVKKLLLTSIAFLCTSSAWAVDITANGALVSQYIYRGIPQTDGKAAGQAGLDITQGGFYVGTWGSTVDDGDSDTNDGIEIDYYGGYKGSVGDFSYGAGVTWYTYTDKFDDEYLELNLTGGWKWFTVDAAIGEYDNFDGPTQDYQFYSLKGELNGFYALYGFFEDDFDGEYYEAGYGNTLTLADTDLFDYSFSVIYSSDDLLGGSDDTNIVVGISKSFDLYSN